MKPYSGGKAIAFSTFDSENRSAWWHFRDGEVLANIHDTTDDFMFTAGTKDHDRSVEIEMTGPEAEKLANWILKTLGERRSPAGQARQQEDRRQAEEHAGQPINWKSYESP